jgi:hypothetical protein
MALFGRRHREAAEPAPANEALVQAAASLGLHPIDDPGFDSGFLDRIKEASRVLHGFPPRFLTHTDAGIPNMFFTDAFTGTIDGRQVTVANVRTPMEAMSLEYMAKVHSTSLVVLELTTLVPYSVEPRARHQVFKGLEMPTGDAAFDAAFRVAGLIAMGESPFASPEVRQRIAAHNDWIFSFDGPLLACVGLPAFEEGDELTDRVHEVIGVVTAFPESVAPSKVDHSVDDLLVCIGELDSVEDAIAFLGTLTAEDRQRLAQSPTPLAKFADVKTPDEITARFMELDVNSRLQVLAMFEKTQ